MLGDRPRRARGLGARARSSCSGAEWYDYEAKYADGGMELRGARRGCRTRCSRRSAGWPCDTFLRVGCAGLARVDFFVEDATACSSTSSTRCPGFTATSVFPKLWEAGGLPFPELCDRLLGLALERYARRARRPRVLDRAVGARA